MGALTLGRVTAATPLGTIWALPAGIAVGLSPRLSRIVQPVAQVAASFPAPMLFPAVVAALSSLGVDLGWGSIALMLLGTQWYIFFNVIAGAVGVPSDLREAAKSYHFNLWQRLRAVYLPAVFPYLVTGWVTATGGAWNASIVSEYVSIKGQTLTTLGLGSEISKAAEGANFSLLAAAVAVMSAMVVVFNRTVWRSCYRLAEQRYLARQVTPMTTPTTASTSTKPLCALRGVRHDFALPNGTPRTVLEDIDVAIYPARGGRPARPLGVAWQVDDPAHHSPRLIRLHRGRGALPRTSPLEGLNPGVAMVFQSFARSTRG